MTKRVVRPVLNATTGLFDEMIRTSVETAVWAIRRHNGALGIGRDCTARAEARQKRIDAITNAEGVMPSDATRVLAEANATRSMTWTADDLVPVSGGVLPFWQVPTTEQHLDSIEQVLEYLSRKPARTLHGALSEARGGHRFGGWGAVE